MKSIITIIYRLVISVLITFLSYFETYINSPKRNIENDPKYFCRHLNDKMKTYNIPKNMHYENSSVQDTKRLLLFRKLFSKV